MVVAQLVERSLPTPEAPQFESSHRQKYNEHLQSGVLERRKIEKDPGNGPFEKTW